jgi:hypothetical protein
MSMEELLIAVNPEPDSRLPYLLRVPLGAGMVFRTAGTWPRTKALYCYPVDLAEWPDEPEIVERVALRSCVRRGGAVDLVLDRAGRTAHSWCSPPPVAVTPCSGSHPAPANRPDPTSAPPPPAPLESPGCRSSSTPASSTPTGSPPSRLSP